MKITQDHVDQALALVLRHARGAPTPHFGDTRGRSASIRRSVVRLSSAELERQFKIIEILARCVPDSMIPKEKRSDLYNVGHEIRNEYWDAVRQEQRAAALDAKET